jgi:hypothetical protein
VGVVVLPAEAPIEATGAGDKMCMTRTTLVAARIPGFSGWSCITCSNQRDEWYQLTLLKGIMFMRVAKLIPSLSVF